MEQVGNARTHTNRGQLPMTTTITSHKEAAVSFLQQAIAGKIREAYRAYIGPGFRHHNPYVRGDAESLRRALEENHAQNPNKSIEVKHVLADGDVVAVHSKVKMNPQDRGIAVVHIFRFENDRVVEFWDVAQAVPENSPNENGVL